MNINKSYLSLILVLHWYSRVCCLAQTRELLNPNLAAVAWTIGPGNLA